MGFLLLVQHVIEQGLIYSLVIMGVFISSRIVRFDDLTVEGSFGLGGAVTSYFLLMGAHPLLTIPLALLCGACSGILTGIMHTRLKMNHLMSGLVVTTALFSISLRIAGSNVSLPEDQSIFALIPWDFSDFDQLLVIVPIAALICWIVKRMLKTDLGILLRAVGDNPQMITSLGKSVNRYKLFGLASANALTALAGAIFVQWTGFFSITTDFH